MKKPDYQQLEPELKKLLPINDPKALMLLARGLSPHPPGILVSLWCYLLDLEDSPQIAEAAKKSLHEYPEASLLSAASQRMPAWALYELSKQFRDREKIQEQILLNENSPIEIFLEIASNCSEYLAQLIAGNQARVIEAPEIIPILESNPNNLQSSTDRLRQFLRLSGIFVPSKSGDPAEEDEQEEQVEKKETDSEGEHVPSDDEKLSEDKKRSLHQEIALLNVGAKVKLGLKGNKEARGILIRDTNKVVALAVLKSPKITEPEVVQFASMKNVCEDVIRAIAKNPQWTKKYAVKINLLNHPKTPLQFSMQYIKSATLRDLQHITKSKTVPPPLRKTAKELLAKKRK